MTDPIPLTEFQLSEVAHGMDVDGNRKWGDLDWKPGARTAKLTVTDYGRAIYRVTSRRDFYARAAADPRTIPNDRLKCLAWAKSLQQVVDKIVAAAGGRDKIPAEYRRRL
jgi:hypothetical protein